MLSGAEKLLGFRFQMTNSKQELCQKLFFTVNDCGLDCDIVCLSKSA